MVKNKKVILGLVVFGGVMIVVSSIEKKTKEIEAQKNLHEFNLELYHKLGFHN